MSLITRPRAEGHTQHLTCQEWSFLCIYFAEFCFDVFLGEDVEMFVHQLAPHKLVPVKVTYHVL